MVKRLISWEIVRYISLFAASFHRPARDFVSHVQRADNRVFREAENSASPDELLGFATVGRVHHAEALELALTLPALVGEDVVFEGRCESHLPGPRHLEPLHRGTLRLVLGHVLFLSCI